MHSPPARVESEPFHRWWAMVRMTCPATTPRTPPSSFRRAVIRPNLIHRTTSAGTSALPTVRTRGKTRAYHEDCPTKAGGARLSCLKGLLPRPLALVGLCFEPSSPPKKCQSEAPSQMSMTIDLPQCQEQRRGGPKNVSLRGEAGADKNEGGGWGGGGGGGSDRFRPNRFRPILL